MDQQSNNAKTSPTSTFVSETRRSVSTVRVDVPVMLDRTGEHQQSISIALTKEESDVLHSIAAGLQARLAMVGNKPVSLQLHALRWLIHQVMASIHPDAGNQKTLINLSDISRMADRADCTVRRWYDRGILPPAEKNGRAPRWQKTVIEKWLAERYSGRNERDD